MARPTVRKQLERPGGGSGARVKGRLRLVAAVDGDGFGYVGASNVDVAGIHEVTADSTGLLSFANVRPNSGSSDDVITVPAGTVYELIVSFPNRPPVVEHLAVPDVTGPVWVQDILTVPPGDLDVFDAVTTATFANTVAGLIPLTQKAAASGVASLDSGGKVPAGQLPDLSGTYLTAAQKAAASGVASLDSGTKVPVGQIPSLAATYLTVAQRAAANGVASLDGTGKVPATQIPNGAVAAGTFMTSTYDAPSGTLTLSAADQVTTLGLYPASRYGVAAGASAATNSAGLQAAIDAAATAGGGIVQLPTNTISTPINFDTTLQIKPYVTFAGSGVSSTYLRYTGTGTAISFATGSVHRFHLRDFYLINAGSGAKGIASLGNPNSISRFRISNVQIREFQYGLELNYSWVGLVENLIPIANTVAGVHCTAGQVNGIKFHGGEYTGNEIGVLIDGSSHNGVWLDGVVIEDNEREGLKSTASNMAGLVIHACYFERNAASDLISPDVYMSGSSRSAQIVHNTFVPRGSSAAGYYHVKLFGGSSPHVRGNSFVPLTGDRCVSIASSSVSNARIGVNYWGSSGFDLSTDNVSLTTIYEETPAYLAVGTNPAQTEGVRLENSRWIAARNSSDTGDVNLIRNNGTTVELAGTGATQVRITDAVNVVLGTTSGTKIGTAASQKLSFFNATPVVQPANTSDIKDALTALGLLASGGATPLDLDGGVATVGDATAATHAVNRQTGDARYAQLSGAAFTGAISGTSSTQTTFVAVGSAPAQSEAIRLDNTKWIAARNSLGTADVNLIRNNGSTVEIAGANAAGIGITDKPIVLGTTTGTQIGTAANQKLGCHGATPTVQRAGAAQAAADATASTQTTPYGYATQAQADGIVTLLNEIRAALVEKGIIKGSA